MEYIIDFLSGLDTASYTSFFLNRCSPSLSSWLLFHSWKALHQWCHTIVLHNWSVFEASFFLWKYCHIILHLVLFLVPKVVFISRGGSIVLFIFFWISFFCHGVFDPGSFGFFFWTAITCSSEQVSSFFVCRLLYAIFPTSQMHFYG